MKDPQRLALGASLAALAAPVLLVVGAAPASACTGGGSSGTSIIRGDIVCPGSPGGQPGSPGDSDDSGGSSGGSSTIYLPICDPGQGRNRIISGFDCGGTVDCGDGGTAMRRYEDNRMLGIECVEPGDPTAPTVPVITPEMIYRAFERMPLPDSELTLQPPGGETLVNFDTIFSTSNDTETTTVSLLGQSLDLEAGATSYEWHHGDGSTQTTDWEGKPFEEGTPMSEFISYRYQDAFETVDPSVDTTWSARFRLNGGPWQPVAGTVTIDGDPASLRVVEGQPNLVG